MRRIIALTLMAAMLLVVGCERADDDDDRPALTEPTDERAERERDLDRDIERDIETPDFAPEPILEQLAMLPAPASALTISPNGRVFIAMTGDDTQQIKLVELRANGEQRPYPAERWHTGSRNADRSLFAPRALRIDNASRLWVLDSGRQDDPGMAADGVKLVAINLGNDEVEEVVPLDTAFPAAANRPVDFAIDGELGVAYIVDAGEPALVMVDLYTGEVQRLLENDAALHTADGERATNIRVALSADLRYLYWQAAESPDIYRLETEAMRFPEMPAEELATLVELFGEPRAGSALASDDEGQLYLAGNTDDEPGLVRFTHFGVPELLFSDPRLAGASALAVSPAGDLLVATSVEAPAAAEADSEADEEPTDDTPAGHRLWRLAGITR